MRLVSLTFNLDPGSGGGGCLPLRRSLTRAAPWPEWQGDEAGGHADSPVAYVLSELAQSPPRLAVEVEREAGDPDPVRVRAVPGTAALRPLPPPVLLPPDLLFPAGHWYASLAEYTAAQAYRAYYEQWQESRREAAHVLGPVPATTVAFPDGADRATVVVPLAEARLEGRGVGVFDIAWRWQASGDGGDHGAWRDLGTTRHRVYTVLRPPTAPWHRRPEGPGDTQVPWVDALDIACRWATGAGDPGEAATAVTQAVNSLGPDLVEYGCPIGALSMYASALGFDVFDCSAFLERLGGGEGNGRYVNCSDCATIVSTFANLLGCDLWQSRMGSYVPAFLTNPILAIGSDRLGSPCGWGLGFTFHEVAWDGACTSDDDVYDACVRLPMAGPGAASTTVPAGIRFGEAGEGQYRDLIAAPTSRVDCVPRPQERKRRVLV